MCAEELVQARIKKAFPLTLGILCFLCSISFPFLPGFDWGDLWNWIGVGWFFAGGCVFVWAAYRRTSELEITSEWVSIRGRRFDRRNIRGGRVFRAWNNGGQGRYVQLEFETMPPLSIEAKLEKAFEPWWFPKTCVKAIPPAKEPSLILTLNETDLADDEITRALGSRKPDQSDSGGA